MFLPAAGVLALGMIFNRYAYKDTSHDKLLQLYDPEDIENNTQVERTPFSQARYLVPDSYADVDDFFSIDPELAVQTKATQFQEFQIRPYDDYVRSIRDLNNTIDIIMYVKVVKTTQTFPSNVPVSSGWQRWSKVAFGTHFVKKIKYGGYALGVVRIKATRPLYLPDIKRAVAKHFGKSGNLSDITLEVFDAFEEEVRNKYVHDTATFSKSSDDPMSLDLSLKGIWKQAIQFQNCMPGARERGVPVEMELNDLSTLDSTYGEFRKNDALGPILYEANRKFDDLRVANERYYLVQLEEVYKTLSREQKKTVQDQWRQMKNPYFALMEAVNRLNITGSANQLDEALAMYGRGADSGKYNREFDELMARILNQ